MSSRDQWPEPFDPGQSGEPPKPRMSGGTKLLLLLLGVGGLGVLLCCGAFGLFAYRFKEGLTENPGEVRARAEEIATIDIPAKFPPVMAMRINMPVVPKMNICMFGGADGMLMLMEIQIPIEQANLNDDQLQNAMRQNQRPGQGPRNIRIESSEERKMEIQGREVSVMFAKGTDTASGKAFRQVMTAFPGKSGTVFLMIQVPEDKWDEAEVARILESIR